MNFYISFGCAFFVGMIFEEVYNRIKLYEQQIALKSLIETNFWSAFCAAGCALLVFIFMQKLGLSGQLATIASVILIKLIQPLGVFILEV